VIGTIAGVLVGMSLVDSDTGIYQRSLLTIADAGYTGTDFIEGFIKSNLPSSDPRWVAVAAAETYERSAACD
jgi:hypothetical protein